VKGCCILHSVPYNGPSSDDYMKSNSALLGGSLKSKPTWSNAFRCSTTSAFFDFDGRKMFGIHPRKFSTSLLMEVMRCCWPMLKLIGAV